ncbi:FAD-dependent oxidoreductase [Kaustia mangrovi]|uniref:FAD-dependent oxidoreductase n=1 Tax=Kaustia mangrovi TaxID=2593653 RepID=A0A7S8HCG5_9HYPH|nr:FAD-dependent oxidoreductase [Kaustia mangrovi]QPC43590.1 FAD-dependent oxidoreductase [Kaustia mangrovi]
MTKAEHYDLCIIGAGSAGLSVAAAAVQFGVRVALIEKGAMGGDCLNFGCVPSKALLAAAKHAQAMRSGAPFGIAPVEPEIDFAAVRDHVRRTITAIAPNDSEERFAAMGVEVIRAPARFLDAATLEAGGHRVQARRFVIATGSTPAVPPIPGLDGVDYLTNETIFDLAERPDHLVVIGGGPIGMELAQAHRRLGARVTVLEALTPLAKDDEEAAAVVLDALRREGVEILSGAAVTAISSEGGTVRATVSLDDGEERIVTGSHLLVAAGRRPQTGGLDLEAAGVASTKAGITVDRSLRTANRRIYAIGDVTGGLQFTHVGNYHAGLVVRNALFHLPVRADMSAIPWVTYTDPELAHVGLGEAEARERHGEVHVLRWPFAENDRAQAEGRTEGFVKVIASRRGRVLGADIVGPEAGELIQPWALAISSKLTVKAMIETVLPYPTLGEVNKRAAYVYYTGLPERPWIRRLVRWLAKLG